MMRIPSNELPSVTENTAADVVRQASQAAESLSDILEHEYRALMQQDLVLIDSLGAEKAVLLESLSNLESQLRQVYSAVEIIEGEEAVQQLLQVCSERNERNRSLVLIALDQNRKALSLLRSVLNLDQTSVYGADGELNADRSKRYLGSA